MAAYDPDTSKRRHIALHPALDSRLPPAVFAFAQERDIVHVERVAVRAGEHASGLPSGGAVSRRGPYRWRGFTREQTAATPQRNESRTGGASNRSGR